VCMATALAKESGIKQQFKKSVTVELTGEELLELNDKTQATYAKHGISRAPGPDCNLSPAKLVLFFVDLLEINDSGSKQNESLSLPARLFLNRRYNNAYIHLTNTFPGLVARVHALCRVRKIGNAFRG
jgi:hypothetical protein